MLARNSITRAPTVVPLVAQPVAVGLADLASMPRDKPCIEQH